MARTWIEPTDELHDYVVAHGMPPDETDRALIAETAALGDLAGMQIAPDQAALLTFLVRLSGARRAVEIGTFTGYSALAVARGLPPDGRLLCCDVSEEWTSIARRYWERAGVADRIELRLGPAVETLRALPAADSFDFAFIDADKGGYQTYYDEVLARLRPGGLICVDNVLWSGRIVEPDPRQDNTRTLQRFNDTLAADDRVDVVMLPVGDGVTLARKRG